VKWKQILRPHLSLTKWSFLPENNWTAEVNLEKSRPKSLEQLFRDALSRKGSLTGQFHGRGTRKQPNITGLFDLADGKVYGLTFNRLRGQLNVSPDEVRIADAELRFFPPGKEKWKPRGAGIITGSASYRYEGQTISGDLVGRRCRWRILKIAVRRACLWRDRVSFRVKANGR